LRKAPKRSDQHDAPVSSELAEQCSPGSGEKRRRLTGKQRPPYPDPWAVKEEQGQSCTANTCVKSERASSHGNVVKKLRISSSEMDAGAENAEDVPSTLEFSNMPHVKAECPNTPSGHDNPAACSTSPKEEFTSPLSNGSEAIPMYIPDGSFCFTATGLELSQKHRRRLEQKLGVKFVDEWCPEVTHLLADTFRRTTKMMSAICAGARIVTPDYIDKCLAAKCLVDDTEFALSDPVCEAAFAKKHGLPGYSLQAAVAEARQAGPLLAGVTVYCSPAVVGRSEMKTLVQAAGARWLREIPELPGDDDGAEPVLLLGKAGVDPTGRLAEKWRLHSSYDAELLREAACTQKLRYDKYCL